MIVVHDVGEPTHRPGSQISDYLVYMDASNSTSFLKPAAALSVDMGVHPSMFNKKLFAHCEALHTAAMEKHEQLLRGVLKSCDIPAPDVGELTPMIYVRSRKFDETCNSMMCEWDLGPSLLEGQEKLIDAEVGPTKVMVTELAHGYAIRKVEDEAISHMMVTSQLPSHLMAVSRNTGECYRTALQATQKNNWNDCRLRFRRRIDVVCHDDHSTNFTAQYADEEEHIRDHFPRRLRATLPEQRNWWIPCLQLPLDPFEGGRPTPGGRPSEWGCWPSPQPSHV